MNTIYILINLINGASVARLDRQGLRTFGYVGPQIIIASSKRPVYKFPHWQQFNFQPPSFPSMCASFIITNLTIFNIFQVTHGYSTSITSTPFLTAPSNPAPCVAAASSSAVGGARASRFLRAASLRRSRYFSFSHSLRSLERRECLLMAGGWGYYI